MTEQLPVPRAAPLPTATAAAAATPVAVYLARLAPRSRRTQAVALAGIAEIMGARREDAAAFPWHQLEYQHTQAIRARLAEKYAPATANGMLAALRGVLKEAWRLGLIDAETYHRAADVPGVRGSTLPRGRALSQGEFRALFGVCEATPGPAGARDAAILAMLYAGGLRRSEAVALDLADVDPQSGAVTVQHGKGNRARLVYIQNGALAALCDWLALRGDDPGPLFMRIRKGGVIVPTRLTDQAVRDIVTHRAEQAGVAACSPHDLRRSMISDLLDAGADVSTIQRLAGHSSVVITLRYDRRGEATKQAAAALLHVPYGRRAR